MSEPDPLSVLHGGDLPVAPDPAFAAALRARLESALSLPTGTEGVDMSGADTALHELITEPEPFAVPRPAALPYLAVADARRAIDWYCDALGAVVVGDPIVMDDNRIGHAELAIGGGVLYLADEFPEIGLRAPAPDAVSVSLMLHVGDTDTALARARARGATVVREIYEGYGARSATVIDPFGHRWMLSGPIAGAFVPIRHGDVGYVAVHTLDADRAAAFYGHVLGWTVDPGTHRVTNTALPTGIVAAGTNTLFCCYAVTDLPATRAAIAEAGGTVGAPDDFGFGPVLTATDAAGTAFAVFEAADDIARPQLNGAGAGELSYLTYEVTDSAAARAFYGRVLHWTFEPGRVDDGWGVLDCRPMSGLAGGATEPATVPMWTVADIGTAVQRVRSAGGRVLQEPTPQPYGLMAECVDDQGARFYLGEF
ncbi:MAG: VOC family protein [Mycobacterium sp.]|nr:VOC family protein [Mycobacterium sp.]